MKQIIVFGAGCFWGVEKYFATLDGVISARSGYAGGEYDAPSYERVLAYRDNTEVVNHTEVVEVTFDDEQISSLAVIEHFWQIHNPTQGNRQGNDVGNNYRSALYFTTSEQERLAHITRNSYQYLLTTKGYPTITTEIAPLNTFYSAEDYHQQYLAKNPFGYCPNHATGVLFADITPEIYAKISESIFGTQSSYHTIAYHHGTEPKFCQKYDLFKDTPKGYFIDKISGERLFSTTERFNSGTGWLSFFAAIDNSIIEIEDTSFGMVRTEVRAKRSGAHLGHVFDGELGADKRRYCINAQVLEFTPLGD